VLLGLLRQWLLANSDCKTRASSAMRRQQQPAGIDQTISAQFLVAAFYRFVSLPDYMELRRPLLPSASNSG
jgi:hypothetical protein